MTSDFHTSKKILTQVIIIPWKRPTSRIAGYSTRSGSRKDWFVGSGLQEEREYRMDFVPDESAIKTDTIELDKKTIDVLAIMGIGVLPGVVLGAEQTVGNIAPTFAFGGAGAHPRRFNRFYDFIIASNFKD